MERRNFLKGLVATAVGAAVLPKIPLPTAKPAEAIATTKRVAYFQVSRELIEDWPAGIGDYIAGRSQANQLFVAPMATSSIDPDYENDDNWDDEDD